MEIYQLINGCLVMEGAVASIYSKFMRMFPEENDFWEDLYLDEKAHEGFLIDIADRGAFDWIAPESLSLSTKLFDDTRKFLSNVRYRIESAPVSLEEALQLALKLEETMVEVFTNELIAGLLPADRTTLIEMVCQERTHIDKIRRKMIGEGFLKLA